MSREDRRKGFILAAALLLAALGLGLVVRSTFLRYAPPEQLEEWVRLFPRDSMALFYLGYRLFQEGQHERAAEVLQRVVALKPGKKMAWVGLGEAYLAQRRLWEGVEALERALAMDPLLWTAAQALGDAYFQVGMFRYAATAWEKSVRAFPPQPQIWEKLGRCYLQIGDLRKAEEVFRTLLHHMPGLPLANVGLGYVALKRGDFDEAERLFRREIGKYLGGAEAEQGWVHLLILRPAQFQPTEGLQNLCLRVAQRFPQDWQPHLLLGKIYAAQGQWALAEKALQQALERAPHEPAIWEEAARLYAATHRPRQEQEAKRRLEALRRQEEEMTQARAAILRGQAPPETFLRLVEAEESRQAIGRALEDCWEGLKRYPNHPTLRRKAKALKEQLAQGFRR